MIAKTKFLSISAAINNPQTSPQKLAEFFNSMSEIASCSYEARAAGVRNGMFLGAARKLCPDIHCVPYQFEQYRQVSQKLYDILVTYSHEIEAVSCDEAYIDVSETLEGNCHVFNSILSSQVKSSEFYLNSHEYDRDDFFYNWVTHILGKYKVNVP